VLDLLQEDEGELFPSPTTIEMISFSANVVFSPVFEEPV
jgi:hypothetical protein